jgi:hypothetical protein
VLAAVHVDLSPDLAVAAHVQRGGHGRQEGTYSFRGRQSSQPGCPADKDAGPEPAASLSPCRNAFRESISAAAGIEGRPFTRWHVPAMCLRWTAMYLARERAGQGRN